MHVVRGGLNGVAQTAFFPSVFAEFLRLRRRPQGYHLAMVSVALYHVDDPNIVGMCLPFKDATPSNL